MENTVRIKLQVPVTPAWERALARAAADRLAGRVPERIGCRTWKVASGSGNPDHIVTIQSVVNLQATCDCIAAQRGLVCRHAAAALDAAITRIAHSDDAPVATPEPTYGPARQTAAEIDAKMQRFAR
jgi:hypothetical protein